jgi:hypothetical protein
LGAFQIFVLLTHPFEYPSIRNCLAPPQEGIKKLAIEDAMKYALSDNLECTQVIAIKASF